MSENKSIQDQLKNLPQFKNINIGKVELPKLQPNMHYRHIHNHQEIIKNFQSNNAKALAEGIARQERAIELSEETNVLLKSINSDTSALVSSLNMLEVLNKTNSDISEANMLIIQRQLEEIIEAGKTVGSETMHEMFLNEFKSQMVEKGAGVAIQFFITGIKQLLTGDISSNM